jgi:uncharacterized membrane protein YkvA (DUF1232 family)
LQWAALSLGALVALYLALVGGLVVAGRPASARALARFVPDAIVLFRRLLADDRVPRRRKAALALGVVYLAMPIDLVPDPIPVVGQLDDALVVAILLRYLARGGGPALLEELWPGPDESLRVLLRIAFGAPDPRKRARTRRLFSIGPFMLGLVLAFGVLGAARPAEPEAGAAASRAQLGALALATAGERPAPGRFPPAPAFEAARSFARARDGQVAFAVVGAHDALHGLDADRAYPSASLVKAMLLVAYLDRLESDDAPLDTAARGMLDAMIRASDNAAATAVHGLVGTAGLEAVAEGATMERFVASPAWGDSSVTAADQARLFARIDRFVPREHRDYALRLLSGIAPEQSWGVPAAAPPRFEVYFKGGWRPSEAGQLVHQGALLERGRRRLGLAVLSDGSPSFDYGVATVEGVAARLLEPQYGSFAGVSLAATERSPAPSRTTPRPDDERSAPPGPSAGW